MQSEIFYQTSIYMEAKRVLIITQEMEPYLALSEAANAARNILGHIAEKGMELRVLMPRFGNINERRHRLHEVVRLSGINIIVKDDDYPLIIKVASLPGIRIQVYFLDNEELFQRKAAFGDDKTPFYDDNVERMVFFCKGALETVKKFGWAPHIIHCHGWMTSLIPLYIKTVYKKEPIYAKSKVVYSVYENSFKGNLGKKFNQKVPLNNLVTEKDLAVFKDASNTNLHLGAINFSDAIIRGSEKLDKDIDKLLKKNGRPILDYIKDEKDSITECYKFFQKVIKN